MFDDDDSEPQFNAVERYYFEEGNGDPVCFTVLPLKFDEIGEVACFGPKKIDLQGFADNGLHRVHKEVVAWRVGLDYEQPKIFVHSSEGNWIELLKPWKCYEKTVRSILITVQMLHFVRKWPRKQKRSLWDHLREVFNKFDSKPAEYDLKKHHSIIKLFAERDPTLMKSKILQMYTGNTSRIIREGLGTKEPTVASSSGDEEDLDNDSDDDYNGNEDNSGDDYSCDDNGSDDQGNGDDKSNDDYSCNDDDSDDDGDIGNDGGTDNLCAICDNGGKLLSCVGQCRRAFHPREKDGMDSNCESLCLTTAQLKEIDHYMCKNCEYKQHQCFSCGDLEPSDGPNAKVFQCYKASCGHFYHPICIAKLLEPDDTDGACKLETKIAAGMSFTCPVHWCSKCGKMEDGTQIALWLAVCRRCPVSYHKKCLPRDISFERKRGKSERAWELDDRIIMYCGRHEIEDTISTPCRDHIRLPSITKMDTIGAHCMDHTPSVAEIDRTRDLAKKKAKVTGKRKMNTDQGSTGTTEKQDHTPSVAEIDRTRDLAKKKAKVTGKRKMNTDQGSTGTTEKQDHTPSVAEIDRTRDLAKKKAKVTVKRKMNTDQGSTGTTEMSNKLCREEADQTQKEATNNSREHTSRKGRGVFKKDTTHSNLVHNDEQDNFSVTEQAEGNKNDTKSGKEKETHKGENAYGRDLLSEKEKIPGKESNKSNLVRNDEQDNFSVAEQAEGNKNNTKSGKEKETHKGENAYGRDLLSEKEKVPGKESNKSGLAVGGLTPGHVDGGSREKLAYEKASTSNRRDTHQEFELGGDQQVYGSYAGKQELKNPQRSDTQKPTEIHTSGDKSRMRRKHGEQATDCKILNLEKNRGKSHMETKSDACYKVQGPQGLHNHTEPGALAPKFTNHDLSSSSTSKGHPRHNDDQRPLKTRESKSSDGRGSGRTKRRNDMGVNSYRGNSPLEGRYHQKGSRVHSPEGRRMDHHQHRYEQRQSDDHSSDGGHDRRRLSHREDYSSDGRRRFSCREDYSSDGGRRRLSRREDYPSDGGGDRRMSSRREDYCSDGDVGRRLSTRQSESSPGKPRTYLRGTEYGGRTRHTPPSYGGRHDPYMNSREREHVHYAMDRGAVPFHGDPHNVEYGRYSEMDMAPVDGYSRQEDNSGPYGQQTDAGMVEEAAFYGGRFGDYGERPDYGRRNRLNSEDGPWAAGSVTDRYIPRLDRTNGPIRSQGGVHDPW